MCGADVRPFLLALMTLAGGGCVEPVTPPPLDAQVMFDAGDEDARTLLDADGARPDAQEDAGECHACAQTELRLCDDGEDSDCDGLVDCDDPDCDRDHDCAGGCTSDESGLCLDVWDNDCDGLVDCMDPDCRMCAGTERDGSCSNSFDDDCDGLPDCRDPDCAESSWCSECSGTEYGRCDDRTDNDGDGRSDCVDVDCVSDLVCTAGVQTTCL